jgi:predicted TIM-barrel fold metal-dependent hydrolase
MIINMHSHLIHRNMWSEKFWDITLDTYSKSFKIPKEALMKTMMPEIANANADALVKAMEKAGIDKALTMGVDWGMSVVGEAKWSVEEFNKWVADQVAEYPGTLYALCAVDPRRGEKAVNLLEKAVTEWGMKGLKFHPTAGYYPDDPKYFPLYEKCVELDVPLYSHTAVTITAPMESKFADPIYLDSVAAKFPDLKIVLVHFGSITWLYKCHEIMGIRPNVYAEISGYQAQAVGTPKRMLEFLRGVFDTPGLGTSIVDKIMWGTDWPLLELILTDEKWVDWVKNIPEKAQEYGMRFKQREIKKILGLNAEKFLKL